MLRTSVFLVAFVPLAILGQLSPKQLQQFPVADYDYSEDPLPGQQQQQQKQQQLTFAASPVRSSAQGAPQTTIRLVAGSSASATPSKSRTGQDQTTAKPEPITILQQINEHNPDDGSYTYGYEGSDGSFKLETRFADGRVKGRYGYVDTDTGALKVIEYGADAMGFQPEGDLPDGIIVPQPVIGNDTSDGSFNGDDSSATASGGFDQTGRPIELASRLTVQTRARQNGAGSSGNAVAGAATLHQQPQRNPSQNRGQDFEPHAAVPPSAPAPQRPQTPQLVAEDSFEEHRQPLQQAAPQQFRPQTAAAAQSQEVFEVDFNARPQPVQGPSFAPAPRPQQQQQQPLQVRPQRPVAPPPSPPVVPVQATFSQETHFEGRPSAAVLANAAPEEAVRSSAVVPPQAFIREELISGVAPPSSASSSPFTSFPSVAAPSAPAQAINKAQPVRVQPVEAQPEQTFEEQTPNENQEQPAPRFNPNRARSNVRQQPAQQLLQQQQHRLQPTRAQPVEAPQPAVAAQPAIAVQPATAAPIRVLPAPRPIQSADDKDENFRPILSQSAESSSRFSSFPIQGADGRQVSAPSRPAAPAQQAAPEQQQQVFQPTPLPAQHQPFQAFPAQAQEPRPQPQAAPQQFQQPQQQFQFQDQLNFQATPQQFQPTVPSPVNFDSLVQEFTGQSRAGRSRQDFQPPPFKFNPVPAVPDL